MKTGLLVLTAILLGSADAQAADDTLLLTKLGEAKFSLVEAIGYAEKTSGPATSAKFEIKNNELVFSVYTAPQGLDASPEFTDLTELLGLATALPIAARVDIFADKAHIARASVHQTLFQLSPLNLKQVIQKALGIQPGTAFSVKNPTVRNHRPVADVSILKADGKVSVVTIDLLTSNFTVF